VKTLQERLIRFDPIKALCLISAYQLVRANLQKIAVTEHAAATFLSYSARGGEDPCSSDIRELLSETGRIFTDYMKDVKLDPLEACFASQYMFMRDVTSPVQNIEAALRRFDIHAPFLKHKLGFNVDEALFFFCGNNG